MALFIDMRHILGESGAVYVAVKLDLEELMASIEGFRPDLEK